MHRFYGWILALAIVLIMASPTVRANEGDLRLTASPETQTVEPGKDLINLYLANDSQTPLENVPQKSGVGHAEADYQIRIIDEHGNRPSLTTYGEEIANGFSASYLSMTVLPGNGLYDSLVLGSIFDLLPGHTYKASFSRKNLHVVVNSNWVTIVVH